jgi:hypothetical protein
LLCGGEQLDSSTLPDPTDSADTARLHAILCAIAMS